MHQHAGTLSGGEQQLVAVCRALTSDPVVLLLDSPTSGLGPAFRAQVADLVVGFVAHRNRSVLLADDDREFVTRVATARATLSGGQLVSYEDAVAE